MTPNLSEIQTEAKITQKWSHLKTDQRQTDGQTDYYPSSKLSDYDTCLCNKQTLQHTAL